MQTPEPDRKDFFISHYTFLINSYLKIVSVNFAGLIFSLHNVVFQHPFAMVLQFHIQNLMF
jgi:uncharacterized membrane protein